MKELSLIEKKLLDIQSHRINTIFLEIRNGMNKVLREELDDKTFLYELPIEDYKYIIKQNVQFDGSRIRGEYFNIHKLSKKGQELLIKDGMDKLLSGVFDKE